MCLDSTSCFPYTWYVQTTIINTTLLYLATLACCLDAWTPLSHLHTVFCILILPVCLFEIWFFQENFPPESLSWVQGSHRPAASLLTEPSPLNSLFQIILIDITNLTLYLLACLFPTIPLKSQTCTFIFVLTHPCLIATHQPLHWLLKTHSHLALDQRRCCYPTQNTHLNQASQDAMANSKVLWRVWSPSLWLQSDGPTVSRYPCFLCQSPFCETLGKCTFYFFLLFCTFWYFLVKK